MDSMFTGIVKDVGTIERIEQQPKGLRLLIRPNALALDKELGASIAVNGVCLTVAAQDETFVFDVMSETLSKTTLGDLKKGDLVNLESSLKVGDELGGHFVYGHVDAVAMVEEVVSQEDETLVSIRVPVSLTQYIVLHGSIAFDGVSLTVARLENDLVTVSLVAHTLAHTTFDKLEKGSKVNVEVDMLAKYICNKS